MVISRRNISKLLTCASLALLCLASQRVYAQQSADKTFRTLAVRRAAPKIFYNNGDKEVQLFAGDTALSGAYDAPPSGKIEVYCYTPAKDPQLPPVKVNLAEAQLSDSKENLLLISTTTDESATNNGTPEIQLLAIDASLDAHPLNTVRVFNFSQRKTAAKIADEFEVIPSGGDFIFQLPEDTKMWVKIAAYEGTDTGWKLRNGGPKAIFPNTRSIIVLSDAYPSEEDPEGKRINLRNVIDRTPPVSTNN